MSETGEDDAEVVAVTNRVAMQFPGIGREHIGQIVQEELDDLAGARVRDFIPVLVEHAATERLRLEAQPQWSPAQESDAMPARIAGPASLDPMEVQRRSEAPSGPLLGNYGGD
jgi:hypothetical protein